MMLKGRRTALAAAGLGLILLTAALAAFRKDLLVEWHLRRLASEDLSRQSGASEGLGEIPSGETEDPRQAAVALGLILHNKPKPAAVILGLLRKEQPETGSSLMDALQSLAASDPAAVSALVEIALEAPEEVFRTDAADRLEGMAGAVSPLIEALSAADPEIRGRAAAALGKVAPDARGADASAVISQLVRAIEDPRFDDGYRPGAPADGERDAPRVAAIRALGSMDPRKPPVIPALLKFLEEGSPPIRRAAAGAVLDLTPYRGGFCGTCGPPPIGPEMFPAFAGAYRALLKRPPPDGDPTAPGGAPDEARLRSGMVNGIAEFAARPGPVQAAATKLLLEALRDPAGQVRALVADCLGRLPEPGPDLIGPLSEATEDSDPGASLAAARTLAHLGSTDPKATEALLKKLRSPRESVRAVCARILEEVGGDPAVVVPALASLLHDPSSPVRALAAETLGFYAHTAESAIPDLTLLLQDEDRKTREAAASALEKIRQASG